MPNQHLNTAVEALYQELKCTVCFSMMIEPYSLPCLHIFCKACIDRCLTVRPNCPLCNANFHRRQLEPSPVISTVIDVYKKLYKALSAITDIPCLSQALAPLPSPHRIKDPRPSRSVAAESTNQNSTASGRSDTSPLKQSSIEQYFPKADQTPDRNHSAHNSENDHPVRSSNSVEFRTVRTPARTKSQAVSRAPPDDAYTEPWSPYLSSALATNVTRCSICYEPSTDIRPLLSCLKCLVPVHRECYGISPEVTEDHEWSCVPCSSGVDSPPTCVLCPNTDDRAFRACSTNPSQWVHVACALWAPQPKFSDTSFGNGGVVENINSVPIASKKLRCSICRKRGFCLQCEYGRCTTAFHVPCATRSTIKLELRELDEKIYFHQFCTAHVHLSKTVPTDNTAGSAFSRRSERRISLSPSPAPKRRQSMTGGRSRSRHQGRFVLLLTGGVKLDDVFNNLMAKSKDVDVTLNLSESVTHVITKCFTTGAQAGKAKTRTVKYMFGVAKGAWCVSHMWIQDWVKFGYAPDELKYEVLGDYAAIGAPRRARVNRQQGRPGLLHGVVFIIPGPFSKHLGLDVELAEIIRAADGEVSNQTPDSPPLKPTVLIKESVGPEEDESEKREDASIRQQCLSIGIPTNDVQWLFGLLSYYSSPIIK